MDRDRQEQTHQDAEIETVGEGRLKETGDAERQRQICERQRDRISWAETMGETEPPGVSGGVRSSGPRGCRCQPAPWPSTPGDWPVCPPHRCFPAGVWGRFAVGWAWGMRGCREQVSVGASVHAGVWMGRWPGVGAAKVWLDTRACPCQPTRTQMRTKASTLSTGLAHTCKVVGMGWPHLHPHMLIYRHTRAPPGATLSPGP